MTAARLLSWSAFIGPWGLVLIAAGAGNGCAANAHRATPAVTEPRKLTLEMIAGTEWVLRKWDLNDPAPAAPEVTLSLKDGKFVGTAGCNRYFAGVKPGVAPGEVTVGPAGATRMMCAQEQMVVEDRFLKQLTGVKKFELMAGQLALSYKLDGSWGVMLFDPHEAGGRK